MLILPESIVNLLDCFAPVFSKRVWRLATVLLVGAILTPGSTPSSASSAGWVTTPSR